MPFRDVIGHRRLVELLARSIDRGTLPPSLILAGPPGAGKRLAALAIAQALNCLQPVRPADPQADLPIDACGECVQCTRIARGVHPDVLVIEPSEVGSSEKKIDQVRAATEAAAYRPFEGRRRVIVFDDAVDFGVAAQNGLLKALEEPPASSVFVLITTQPEMLLVTVRSRCIRLNFVQSSFAIDHEAREIAHQVLAQSAAAGTADGRRIDSAKNLLANIGKGGASDRDQLARYLHAMASLLRDAALVSTHADARALANSDVVPAIERLASSYRGDRGVRAYAAVDKALEALDRNAGVKIVADWLVLQL